MNTIKIGTYDVPKPLLEHPPLGTVVYPVVLLYCVLDPVKFCWIANEYQLKALKANLLHLTSEAAQIHADALISVSCN